MAEFDIGSIMGKGGGGGMLKGGGGPWSAVGAAADTICSFLPEKTEYSGDKGGITKGLDSAYDTISDAAMMIPGVGTMVGGIMKAGKVVGAGVNALGGGTDGMTTTDAILGSSFFNLTPLGLINGFGGKKADTFTKDTLTWALMGSSYGGSEGFANIAAHKSGKKYGKFSESARLKANALIKEAGRLQGVLEDMSLKTMANNELLANQSSMAAQSSAYEASGGFDATSARAARFGMKFPSNVNRAIRLAKGAKIPKKEVVYKYDFSILDELEVLEFKDGGSINVIPEGALHAHKHHMEEQTPELKDLITKKGIPVIVEEEGGEISQQAEIERNEIIFNLETTKELERLNKIYHSNESSLKEKDDAAIQAGKLLTEEILNNTDDRTGLINTVE